MKTKTKLAILVALASAGTTFGASAIQLPPLPDGKAPSLYPVEQGAFKALEVAAHLVEAHIVQKGCTARSYPISVNSRPGSNNGNTDVVLDGVSDTANPVKFGVNYSSASSQFGRKYTIAGPVITPSSTQAILGGLKVDKIKGTGSFNIGSTIQEENVSFTLQSPQNLAVQDSFYGSVIKDYWRPYEYITIPTTDDGFFENQGASVDGVIDYGLQQISKKGYVAAKYWQYSKSWRQNGVNAGTHWTKTLITPAGTNCSIEVKLQGYGVQPADTIDGFNEKGTIAVVNGTGSVGPFKN